MSATLAEALVASLARSGVRRIYGITGDSLNSVADAVRRDGTISWVHTRHEEAAAFAAAAEAYLTGTLAVCAGSCGPGNLHLINGLYEAHRDRVPVLAIASQIPTAEIGSNYFQETHPQELFRECSAYVELVLDAVQFPAVYARAVRTAVARRDVAVLVLPGDVGWQPLKGELVSVPTAAGPVGPTPSDADVGRLAAWLNEGERVTILAGAGCAQAHDELMEVARALCAPVVHALRGKESVEPNNPFDVGMTGLLGFSSGYVAMERADTLLIVGSDFPYRAFYPEKARIAQIDARGEQIGRRTRVDLAVVGDAAATLRALVPRLSRRTGDDHLRASLDHYRKARAELDGLAVPAPDGESLHPQFVARTIDQLAAADAIFTCDVGTPTLWAARYLTMNGRRRLLGSFSHGSMANALPQAIGAQLVAPERPVIALSGDGGLSMLLGELLTLRQHRLPVKVVVFNNGALGFVELEMKAAGLLEYATDLVETDFAALARAAGLRGTRVESSSALRPALEEAFAASGPAVVDVRVNRLELSKPPKLTWAEASGFSLYLMKAVLSGQGDEVVELGKRTLFG